MNWVTFWPVQIMFFVMMVYSKVNNNTAMLNYEQNKLDSS